MSPVRRQIIVAIEQANSSPTLKLAFKIARVVDKPLEEVFFFDDQREESVNRSVAPASGADNV